MKADFEFIGVVFDEEKFCHMSQVQFKTLIQKKINLAAFEEYKTVQIQHSKVQEIPYQVLAIQTY